MKKNIIKDKSFEFAIRTVRLCKLLSSDKQEFVLSKQLLRSGTSVGALIREAEHAESKLDFIHKMAIAQKECNESMYWLEILKETDLLSIHEFESIYSDATELIKLITSIIKTAKSNIKR